ncbi:dienelactone hydrolase family protein [Phenylobacterium sp.]|uniref:dienelactone hydrolase family protein n=1 Tax=Phenylobacterium sp. TaxID=1871053 RepID=UPI0030F48592
MDDTTNPASANRDSRLTRRGFATVTMATGVALAGAALAAEVIETDVTITTADGSCDAAYFHPAGKGKWPGVVIFTDILGLRPAFRDMGKRMAAAGYAVVVPNPFYRTRKAPVITGPFEFSNPTDRAKLTELVTPLTPGAKALDTAAYVAWLDQQPQVDAKKKIGTQGYCMGGLYTFLGAINHPTRVGAAGSFHGGGLVTDKPDSIHLQVGKAKAGFLVAIAEDDDAKQPEAKDKLRAAFAAAGATANVEVYGAKHGWCVKDGAVYSPAEAERAWAALTALYRQQLI